MGEKCPFCHRDMRSRKPPRLYGNAVCRSCYWGFAGRRHLAFVIDWLAFVVLINLVAFFVGIALMAAQSTGRAWQNATLIMLIAGAVVFCCKDGFSGYSLGKRLCGVRVVHGKTGQPAGFFASLIRNLPLLVPFLPVIVAVQLLKGQRVGDSSAATLVVWNRYSEAFIFPESLSVTGTSHTADTPVPDAAPVAEDGNPYRPPAS